MRKLFLVALLTSIATPALADDTDPQSVRAEARAERAERAQRAERPSSEQSSRQFERRSERVERRSSSDGGAALRERSAAGQRALIARDGNAVERPPLEQRRSRAESDSVRDWRANERRASRTPETLDGSTGWREGQPRRATDADVVREPRLGDRERRISRVPVPGSEPEISTRHVRESRHRWSDDHRRRWRHDWRRDGRHDWWNWRRRHHSLFRLGFYYDPFGWGYRRYDIGYRLWPSYYGSRYWLNDPWRFRLPYAPAGYRWIRYWDDAILVDTWTGEVVDVIHNFFW
jgi:hypothetical protein